MDERRFWVTLWLGLAGILWIGIVLTCLVCRAWDMEYIKAGYTRFYQPGHGLTWVKPESE